MSKNVLSFFIVLLVAAGGLYGYRLNQDLSILTEETTLSPAKKTIPQDPVGLVQAFYEYYFSLGAGVLTAKSIADYPGLSDKLRNTLLASVGGNGEDTDPILCAQDKPSRLTVGNPQENAQRATVYVELTYGHGKRLLPVILLKTGNSWEIDSIACDHLIQ